MFMCFPRERKNLKNHYFNKLFSELAFLFFFFLMFMCFSPERKNIKKRGEINTTSIEKRIGKKKPEQND